MLSDCLCARFGVPWLPLGSRLGHIPSVAFANTAHWRLNLGDGPCSLNKLGEYVVAEHSSTGRKSNNVTGLLKQLVTEHPVQLLAKF